MIRAVGLIGASLLATTFNFSLFAKCPVSDGATLIVRAPVGDVQVDTTARDGVVDVQVDSSVQLQENCNKDSVEFTSNASEQDQTRGALVWRVVAPRNINRTVTATKTMTMGRARFICLPRF